MIKAANFIYCCCIALKEAIKIVNNLFNINFKNHFIILSKGRLLEAQ